MPGAGCGAPASPPLGAVHRTRVCTECERPLSCAQAVAAENLELPGFKHLLVAFGGPLGLEAALEADKKLKGRDTNEVFDLYLNTCAGQGSRTIRTEEAVLISMAYLQSAVARSGARY